MRTLLPIKHLCVALVLGIFMQFSKAAYFEVEPDVTEWDERACALFSQYPRTLVYWCHAVGGTWYGTNSNPQCSVENYGAVFAAFPFEERVSLISQYGKGMCSAPTVSFSGWGTPTHHNLCWNMNNVVGYYLGVEVRSTGKFDVSGVTGATCEASVSDQLSALRTRTASCPAGSTIRDEGKGQRCYKFCPDGKILVNGSCDTPPEKNPCNQNYTLNPCNVATGNKYRAETDFSGSGLPFTRYYNSSYLVKGSIGVGWRSSFSDEIIRLSSDSVLLLNAAARSDVWNKVVGVWQGDADSKVTLIETGSGFRIIRPNSDHEDYNSIGQIVSKTDANGHDETFTYNSRSELSSVTNRFGRSLSFTYSDGKIETIEDSANAVYRYEYDALDNLVKVLFPDETLYDDSDNPFKIYHYENVNFPNHLTGITDENGNRYATFDYDSTGKAVLSELGTTTNPVGQQKIQLDY